jgi:CRP-like cAMP-binding protein
MSHLLLNKDPEGRVNFKKGDVLFMQEENPSFLYLIKAGQVLLIKMANKHISVVGLVKEKEFVNEMSILTNKATTFSAIAKSDGELICIKKADLTTALGTGPVWMPEVFKTLCERLKSTEDIIEKHNLLAGEKDSSTILNLEEEKMYHKALEDYKALYGSKD